MSLFADLLRPPGEIRPGSPAVRPAQSQTPQGDSPFSPFSPLSPTSHGEGAERPATGLAVECWTPAGGRMTIQADSGEHAAWLRRMNPPPKAINAEGAP